MRRLARLALIAAVPLLPLSVHAQPSAAAKGADRDAVKAAVLDYVEGFYDGDTTRLVRSVSTDVRKYGYFKPKADGPYAGEPMPYSEFMSYANRVKARGTKPPAGAPKEIVLYDVQDQTASAKLTAWWGIDYLLLAKQDNRWKITHVLWQSPPPK